MKHEIKNAKALGEFKKPTDKTLCFELDGRVTEYVIVCTCIQDELKVYEQTYKRLIYTTTQDKKYVTNIVCILM